MAAPGPATIRTAVRAPDASVLQYLVALPHIAYGGGWRTQIVIGNPSATPAEISLFYFGNDGNPLTLSAGGATSDRTTLTVPAYGAQTLEPDWTSPTTTAGWAALVYTNASLKIQGIFLWHQGADPADKYTEATTPIVAQSRTACIIPLPGGESADTVLYDETDGRYSGYGFANTTSSPVTLSLTAYDQSGRMVGQYSETLAGFGHNQFLVRDKLPGAVNSKGNLQVRGLGVAVIGFRFSVYNTFTTWLP